MPASRLGSLTPTNDQPTIVYEADRSYIASVIVTNIGNVEHYFTIYVTPVNSYTVEEDWVYYASQTKINKFNSYESVRFAINEGDRIVVQSYLGEGLSFSVNGVYDSFGRTMVHTSISNPRDPAVGDIWVRTVGTNKLVFIWNGTAWTAMTDAYYSTTAPPSPELGRFWIDSTSPSSPLLKSWNGTAWVVFSGQGASLAPYDAHIAATTNVHGITSTAALVYTDDARLSNARTPSLHASSHATAGSDPITVAKSQVTDLVSDLSTINSSLLLKAPLANPSFTGTVTAGGVVKANSFRFNTQKPVNHYLGVLSDLFDGPSGTAVSTDGNSSAVQFNEPSGIATDLTGNFYISDRTCIRKIVGGNTTTIVGSTSTPGDTNAQGVNARFTLLTAIAYNKLNDLMYVADSVGVGGAKIKRIDAALNVTTLITLTSVTGVYCMILDNNGDLIISTTDNKIEKVTAAGSRTLIAGNTYGFLNATGASALFRNPSGIAQLSPTEFLVCDEFNNRIRKVTTSGVTTTYVGSGAAPAYSEPTGSGLSAIIAKPRSIALSSSGVAYIGSEEHILRIEPGSLDVSLVAGTIGRIAYVTGIPGALPYPGNRATMHLDETANRLYFTNSKNAIGYIDLS